MGEIGMLPAVANIIYIVEGMVAAVDIFSADVKRIEFIYRACPVNLSGMFDKIEGEIVINACIWHLSRFSCSSYSVVECWRWSVVERRYENMRFSPCGAWSADS